MATEQQNAVKREEMKFRIAEARAKGWTTSMLATEMGVTAGTISAWTRGASMGTNRQREALAKLPLATAVAP